MTENSIKSKLIRIFGNENPVDSIQNSKVDGYDNKRKNS